LDWPSGGESENVGGEISDGRLAQVNSMSRLRDDMISEKGMRERYGCEKGRASGKNGEKPPSGVRVTKRPRQAGTIKGTTERTNRYRQATILRGEVFREKWRAQTSLDAVYSRRKKKEIDTPLERRRSFRTAGDSSSRQRKRTGGALRCAGDMEGD